MINIRYHIVSIMAVFLALGLGILLGSSVVSDAVDAQLSEDLTTVRRERDTARDRVTESESETAALRELLTEQISPWALDDRLSDAQIVLISDGTERAELREHVEDAIVAAGAESAGVVTMRDRWQLADPEDLDALSRSFTAAGLGFDAGDDPAAVATGLLGQSFLQPAGRELITALSDEEFISVDREDEGSWPPPSSIAIVLSPSRRAETASIPHIDTLALGLADATPTLVVTDRPEGQSVVTQLRQANVDRTDSLATFDAATDQTDPGGIGVVAAMLAATDGQGGDWGVDGERFIPPNVQD